MDNPNFLKEQIITYLGNKRKLLDGIGEAVEVCLADMGREKAICLDMFSGSGIVARYLKQYSTEIHANDIEKYSYIINSCYLTNQCDFNRERFRTNIERIKEYPVVTDGIIATNYAPQDTDNIQKGERCFYTHENAVRIDTWRTAIEKLIPIEEQPFYIAPLLYEASVHANTSGVFKGFYKSKTTKIGKFGGEGETALDRIKGEIVLGKEPVFSDFDCISHIHKEDANVLAKNLKHIDITYIDPPYNQHPYGSNYFMLNTIAQNRMGRKISNVSGIPSDWNKSAYNKKKEALSAFENLINELDSKYLIISYNNEGFISLNEMETMLSRYGRLETKSMDYVTFRGGRNIKNRNSHTTEYVFILKKII